MIGIRLVCAWDALDVARNIARLLSAEGFVVSTTAGRVGLDELKNPDRPDECRVIVWSVDGNSSPYVWKWVEDGGEGPLIEIEIARDIAPAHGKRTHDPIDFSKWRGDRGGAEWQALEERLRQAVLGKAPPPGLRQRAAVFFGVIALVAGGGAGLMRMFEDGTQSAEATAPQMPFEPVDAPTIDVGGPTYISAELEEPFVRGRLVRARPLQAVPAPTLAAEAELLAPMEFRNRSLLDSLFRPTGGEG